MMKSFVITLINDAKSVEMADKLKTSSKFYNVPFEIETFEAVTPEDAMTHRMSKRWNYPWEGSNMDFATGLLKTAYPTVDRYKRIACFLSHYSLWRLCATSREDVIIFEHDAMFTSPFSPSVAFDSKFSIIGINDPRGATRKSLVFYDEVKKNIDKPVIRAPKIDDDKIPQGLAGNSAYCLKPEGAWKLLDLVDEYGAWPNDALMCRQLLPRDLGVTTTFYTKIQKHESSTSL